MTTDFTPLSVPELEAMAATIRCDVIEMIAEAQAGHPGGSLSAADIVTALYFRLMRLDPENPDWPDRDRFILSKGHACPVWYSALAERGFFDKAHLGTLRKLGSILQGHPDMRKTPGIDYTTGSLGNGLSIGAGMAMAGKLDRKDYRVYVMLGCGELQEGLVWEGLMTAAKFKLDNLCVIIDYNQLQLDGHINEVMSVEPLLQKLQAFNAHVVAIDGHDVGEIQRGFDEARAVKQRPTVLLANTVKGKGVSYMENQFEWHGVVPNEEQFALATQELEGC